MKILKKDDTKDDTLEHSKNLEEFDHLLAEGKIELSILTCEWLAEKYSAELQISKEEGKKIRL